MSKILGAHIPTQIKNLAINGALDFWQEKAGTTTTVNTATNTTGWSADMWTFTSLGSTVKNYSFVRSTDVPSIAQSGFNSTYSNLFTMVTGIASPAAGDYMAVMEYKMEGLDYEKIHSKVVTFGFWIKASIAGTYSFGLKNSAANRSYVTTFAINGANTWEYKSITVQLDSSGTWLFDTGIGLDVNIGAISGSTYSTSSLNTWQAGNFIMASTATNYQATTGATVRIAQFSIVEGSLGLASTGFIRAGDTITDELMKCERYYEKSYEYDTQPGTAAGEWGRGRSAVAGMILAVSYHVRKRIGTPTVSIYATGTGNINNLTDNSAGTNRSASSTAGSSYGFTLADGGALPSGNAYSFHFTSDARL